jgi:hypothetical protein
MAGKKRPGAAFRAGLVGLGLCVAAGSASAADSMCAPGEEVFFNCRIKDSPKLLSVCGRGAGEASRGVTVPGTYLQYRFGSHDKPELVFPGIREGSLDRFRVANEYVPSAFYESHQLTFESGSTEYRVYAINEMDGPDSVPDKYGGVIVSTSTGRDITIPCGSAPETSLGALVRKPGSGRRDGQPQADGITRTGFQICKAMPFNSSDSDFHSGEIEYVLAPQDDAFMLGRQHTLEVIELGEGAVERLVTEPQHGKLARHRNTAGHRVTWHYTPAPGFVGNDRAEFLVRGKTKTGEPVEFRLCYKLRVTPEKHRAYLPQPDPPLLSVWRTYCLIPIMTLDDVRLP